MSIFFAFHHFCEKTYEKTYQFYDLFSNFLSLCARSQNFVVWIFFSKIWRPFQKMLTILFISATLSNICDKTYERTYEFFKYFQTVASFLCLQNFLSANLKTKNTVCFNMWTKPCLLFQQLWTIFFTKIMKNPTIFVTYFWSFFQFVHCHAVLLWPHFYNKNDGHFNVANKLLLISKGILTKQNLISIFKIYILLKSKY